MVTAHPVPETRLWPSDHFVGGHPVLDLVNTVFDRRHPAEHGELLTTASDVLAWCVAAGLVDAVPSPVGAAARDLVPDVRAVREDAWAVFGAISRGDEPPGEAFGALLERAGAGVRAGDVRQAGAAPDRVTADWAAPGAIPAALSLLAVHAVFRLPADRIHACGRCGWLFLDSSRGGRRRWCSMRTCGNREKASRHRQTGRAGAADGTDATA